MSEWRKIKDVVFGPVSDLVQFYEKLKSDPESRSESPQSEESENLTSDEQETTSFAGSGFII